MSVWRGGIIAISIALLAWPQTLYGQSATAAEMFARGYERYSSRQYRAAKELFQATVESEYRLADYSLYYLATIAFNEGEWQEARDRVDHLKTRFPQSIWSQAAALLVAKIDMEEGKHEHALEALRKLGAAPFGKREIADEALFLRGQIREKQGRPRHARAIYNELRSRSPQSRWAAAAREAQAGLRAKYPELFALHTVESLAAEAERLTRERQVAEAATLYKKLLNIVAEPDLHLRYLVKLSGLYLSVRNRGEAMPLLEQIARDYPETAEAPKALYQIGNILWNRHDNEAAFEYFVRLIEHYPNSPDADRARFAAADIHEFFGRKAEATQLYARIIERSGKNALADNAGWRLAWLYYRDGDPSAAMAEFKRLARRSRSDALANAAIYWQARSAERIGEEEIAKQLYRRIFFDASESYYQGLAHRALARLGEPVEELKPPAPRAAEDASPPLGPGTDFHLSRARELGALSLHQLAVAELDQINGMNPDGRLRTLLMREYFNNRAYARSLALANQMPKSDSERDLYRYPLAFWDLIRQKAQERDLDPYLIAALIRQESLFDVRARSPAAALGLMQLIRPTAARVAGRLGLAAPSREKLFDPEINLTLGTQYLKDLLERYSNDWHKALAAYNAGEAAVDRWEQEIVANDVEEFVEQIPYVETRGYVKLILRNHRIYKLLYEQ